MSTRFYLRNSAAPPGLSSNLCKMLSTQRGDSFAATDHNATTTGPTAGIQVHQGGIQISWFTSPLAAGSIAGVVTVNLWGYESLADANVGPQITIDRVDGSGNFQETIASGEEGVEFGTSASLHTWTITPGSTITVAEGDRIRVRVYGNDAGGTMLNTRTFTVDFDGPALVDGDSWVEFIEDLSLDVYPTPTQDGPQYLKFLKRKKDYNEITVKSVFEDGGVDTLEHAADAPQRYDFIYDGLSDQEVDVLDAFWDAHRLSRTFTLIEPRDEPWTGAGNQVEVQFESFEGDHEKVWVQSRKVVLVHYPA